MIVRDGVRVRADRAGQVGGGISAGDRVAEQDSDCRLLCELQGIGGDSAEREDSILRLVPFPKDARVSGLEVWKSQRPGGTARKCC